MTITITQGTSRHPGTWDSFERLTESTATVPQNISPHTNISFLGVGTATGGIRNRYDLLATTTASGREGDAMEGMEKYITCTATGEANLFIAFPTQGRLPLDATFQSQPAATGDFDQNISTSTSTWRFQSDGDFMYLKFMNGAWNYLSGAGPTMGTGT